MFEHLLESPIKAIGRHMTEEFVCKRCHVTNYVRKDSAQACVCGQQLRALNLWTDIWCYKVEIKPKTPIFR
jgi:hypothetical protein